MEYTYLNKAQLLPRAEQNNVSVFLYMSILDIFLKKKGVASPEELDNTPNSDGSPTEREVFDKWRATLSKDELTTEDIKNFCGMQKEMIESKWRDLNLAQSKKAEMIPYHTVYSILISAINAPKAEREQLENQLNQLLQ